MAAEFPIRKSLGNPKDKPFDSTNVDYAYLVMLPKPIVVFLELKTDTAHRDEQLAVYQKLLDEKGRSFNDLFDGIKGIESDKPQKYKNLIAGINSALEGSVVDQIRLVYLAPKKPTAPINFFDRPDKKAEFVPFSKFIETLHKGLTRHRELFELVKPLFLDVAKLDQT